MSRASILSASIGPYLIKGWTLTDSPCPTRGCGAPRLGKPNSTLRLCPACDSKQLSDLAASGSMSHDAVSSSASQTTVSSHSRPSTPATDSSRPQSPDLRFVETPEVIARREQSDRAAAEMGRRLLQGWAMLADECQNAACEGTPLMRPPPTPSSAGKNPRMECVVCGTVYVSPKDAADLAIPAAPEETSKSEVVGRTAQPPPQLPLVELMPSPTHAATPGSALSGTANSLETALQRMSSQLAAMSERTPFDTRAIGEAADAISKVTDALSRVQQLQAKPAP